MNKAEVAACAKQIQGGIDKLIAGAKAVGVPEAVEPLTVLRERFPFYCQRLRDAIDKAAGLEPEKIEHGKEPWKAPGKSKK